MQCVLESLILLLRKDDSLAKRSIERAKILILTEKTAIFNFFFKKRPKKSRFRSIRKYRIISNVMQKVKNRRINLLIIN